MEVQLCTSCLRSSAEVESPDEVQKFIEAVQKELIVRHPEVPWRILPTGCQRFCPEQKITMVVAAQMMMSPDVSLVGVVKYIERIYAKSSGKI